MHLDKPYYKSSPIKDIDSLADFLQVGKTLIENIIASPQDYYDDFVLEVERPDGTIKHRKINDPKRPLKHIQRALVDRLFSRVEFPEYLMGGIPDEDNPRDYVANAQVHCAAHVVISNDIRNFFPSIRPSRVRDIFKFFFHFPDDVAEAITSLVTLDNFLPQGAPTSSYIANLVFYDLEYSLVSYLRGRDLIYTRLIDDIVVSSKGAISSNCIEDVMNRINTMVHKVGCKLHNKKKSIVSKRHPRDLMAVTGLWVNGKEPKLGGDERRAIRAAVYECEMKYRIDPTSKEYHETHNSVSGRVAKLARLKHPEAWPLRDRLAHCLPYYAEKEIKKVRSEVTHIFVLAKRTKKKTAGLKKRIDRAGYRVGIVARTDKHLACSLRNDLRRARGMAAHE